MTVRASTAVQGGGGVNFGKLSWVEGTRLHVQADTSLAMGEAVVLRVDLSPVPGTAMLRGVVARVLPTAPGESQAYLIRLDSVANDDQVRWTQFLHAKRSGGTLSDLSDVRDSSNTLQPTYASVAERERRAAVARMGGTTSHPTGVGGATTTGNHTWSSSAVNEGGGRAAMRDALKAALGRTQGAPGAPSAPPGSPPPAPSSTRYVATPHFATSTASGAATRSTVSGFGSNRPAAPPTPPPPRPQSAPHPVTPGAAVAADPVWLASNLGGTTYVQVEWKTSDTFSFDVHTQLSAGVLTLLSDGRPLPQAGTLFFVLKHQAVVVQAKASVAEHQGFSATYRLELDASHLAELRRLARSTSNVSGVTPVDPARRR